MNNGMTINFEITTACNQTCTYCKQHDESVPLTNRETLTRILDRIFELPKQINKFCFYGGEPTVHPQLDYAMDYVLKKNPNIEMFIHSNMKRSLEFYENMIKAFPKIQIAASFQIHQMKDPYSQVEKIIELHKKGNIYCCDFSLEYNQTELTLKCFHLLKDAGILVKPMPISYLKASERKISEIVNDRIYSKIWDEDKYSKAPSETKDKLCMAGFNYLFIRHNGDAIRCTTYRTRDPEGLKYGNLLDSFDRVLDSIKTVMPCQLDRCTCTTELNLA